MGVEVDGIGVLLGINVFVAEGIIGVLVGSGVVDAVDVSVGVGVIDGVKEGVNVRVGRGVLDGVGVLDGIGVSVGGGMGVGVKVEVGVGDGVQEVKTLGTAFRLNWQPLAKSMITPKSEFITPVSDPPPPQSPSKSISQL